MAIQRFKVALNAARFPLVSTKGQRAVFVPGLDSAPRTHYIYRSSEENLDPDLAQIIYGENFMPVSEGLKSVGYRQLIAPTVNTNFDQIFALRDDAENTVLYSPAAGSNYIYDETASAWSITDLNTVWGGTVVGNTAATKVTYAYVDGKTFVCYSRLTVGGADASIMYWNSATKSLEPAGDLITNLIYPSVGTPTPGVNGFFTAGTIDGISSSNGYLIVYSGIEVAWAPFITVDVTSSFNFTIYAAGEYTGAGRQIPEDVQGNIKAVLGVSGGFILFTSKNAIAATYHAQNVTAPWIFKGISNAGGLESYEQATVEGSLGALIAYTTTGLQKVSLNSSAEAYPDVSDFIAGRYIERYDFNDQSLREAPISLDFFTKISNIANRYIVISYGTFPGLYSFALVYDVTLQRWGKLRIIHRDCFYYNYGTEVAGLLYTMMTDVPYDYPNMGSYASTNTNSNAIVAAQHGLAFLKEDGSVHIADWSSSVRDTEDEAVVIIGKIQLTRASNVQFNRAEIEGINTGRIFLQPSYNGKSLEPAIPLVDIETADNYRVVGGLIDCKNFNLIIEGSFDLSTVVLEATTSGRV